MATIPSSSDIRRVIALAGKRDSLIAQLAKVDDQIHAAFGGGGIDNGPAGKTKHGRKPKAALVPAAKSKTSGKMLGRRGKSKDLIVAVLQSAGSKGISVAEISKKTGIKPANVHVWFSTTGKGIKEIKKVGPGVYRQS